MGSIICNCMMVEEKEIITIIRDRNVDTLKAIEELTAAGTGCGRCIRVIKYLIEEQNLEKRKD